jgi:hypothetical protein
VGQRRAELVADPQAVTARDDGAGPVTDPDGIRHLASGRIYFHDGEVKGVGHPYRGRGDGDAGWPGADE